MARPSSVCTAITFPGIDSFNLADLAQGRLGPTVRRTHPNVVTVGPPSRAPSPIVFLILEATSERNLPLDIGKTIEHCIPQLVPERRLVAQAADTDYLDAHFV